MGIKPIDFYNLLFKNNVNFFTGVPDSLLKQFCLCVDDNVKKNNHVIAANEGNAIGLAAGHYLATGKLSLVYMQNSGLGNAINPIISLAEKKVYNIPLFLIIGWRGEQGTNIIDEPQHIAQGKVTTKFLNNLSIDYEIISKNSNYRKIIKRLKNISIKKNKIVALLIRKNSFENKKNYRKVKKKYSSREEILKLLFDILPKKSNVISTTGILSRELNEINLKFKKINNFMCVGGMGHAISIASGVAKKSKKKIFCFDGDGSMNMHLGSLTISSGLKNIVHVVFNNESHESVGGHKTSSKGLKLYKIAKELGYNKSYRCYNKSQILKNFNLAIKNKNSSFIEIMINNGHRKEISRPSRNMINLKKKFMEQI